MAYGDRVPIGDRIHSGDAGTTSGSYTATAKQITRIIWYADSSAGTVTITPAGGSAIVITIPADSGWNGMYFFPGELPAGSSVVFATVLSNAVFYTP